MLNVTIHAVHIICGILLGSFLLLFLGGGGDTWKFLLYCDLGKLSGESFEVCFVSETV